VRTLIGNFKCEIQRVFSDRGIELFMRGSKGILRVKSSGYVSQWIPEDRMTRFSDRGIHRETIEGKIRIDFGGNIMI